MYNTKKTRKIEADPTKHYPNQGEATMLRKLMAQNGLTEGEVRDVKKYRVMLAEAAKTTVPANYNFKYYKRLIKEACKVTKLAKEHPDTIAELDSLIAEEQLMFSSPLKSAVKMLDYVKRMENKRMENK